MNISTLKELVIVKHPDNRFVFIYWRTFNLDVNLWAVSGFGTAGAFPYSPLWLLPYMLQVTVPQKSLSCIFSPRHLPHPTTMCLGVYGVILQMSVLPDGTGEWAEEHKRVLSLDRCFPWKPLNNTHCSLPKVVLKRWDFLMSPPYILFQFQ